MPRLLSSISHSVRESLRALAKRVLKWGPKTNGLSRMGFLVWVFRLEYMRTWDRLPLLTLIPFHRLRRIDLVYAMADYSESCIFIDIAYNFLLTPMPTSPTRLIVNGSKNQRERHMSSPTDWGFRSRRWRKSCTTESARRGPHVIFVGRDVFSSGISVLRGACARRKKNRGTPRRYAEILSPAVSRELRKKCSR